jgi:hypothetical protein
MIRFVTLVFLLIGSAQPALAGGNICIMHGPSPLFEIVLSKPKLPKALGSTALTGFLNEVLAPLLNGTLMR